MRGLLGTEFDDPKTQGLLSLGLALLNGRGNLGQALSDAGSHGMAAYNAARDAKDSRETRALQRKQLEGQLAMQQAQAAEAERMRAFEAARMQALRDSVTPGQTMPMPATMDARDIGTPGAPALQTPGGLDLQGYAMRLAQAGDPSAVQVFQALQKAKPAPVALSEGGRLVDPETGRVVADNPKAPKDEATNDMREYRFAVSQGYQGTFEQYQRQMKAAGATRVQTNVNAVKPLAQTVAEGLGQQLDNSLAGASSATGTIRSAQELRTLLDSGKVITGPGADAQILLTQIGAKLGVAGRDAQETLANTRTAIQNLAQSELQAASTMKGQGAITDAERELLRKAASGNINMTTGELRALTVAMEKNANARIVSHQQNVQRMQAIPEMAPLIPFYQAPQIPGMPPAPARPAQGQQAAPNRPQAPRVVDFNSLPPGR